MRVHRHAAPVHAAHIARLLDRALQAGWREVAVIAHLAVLDPAQQLVEHRHAPHPAFAEVFGPDGGHAHRVGLRGRQRLFGHGAVLRHGFFGHLGQGLAGGAIQQKHLPPLGGLQHRGHAAALAVGQIDQGRLRGQVVVPDVVVHGLKVPARPPGADVQGHQRRVVLVRVGRAVAPEVVGRGIAQGRIDQAQLVVVGRGAPHVGRARGVGLALGGLAGGGRVAQVPGPHQLPGAGAEGADHARGLAAHLVVHHPAAHHDQVACHQRGRGLEVEARPHRAHALRQRHGAVLPEAFARLAAVGVQRDQAGVHGGLHDALTAAAGGAFRAGLSVVPVAQAATALPERGAGLGVEHPALLAGVGVQRDHPVAAGAAVEQPADLQRGVLVHPGLGVAAAVGPGGLQAVHGVTVDLVEGGIATPLGCATVGVPISRPVVAVRCLVGQGRIGLHHAMRYKGQRQPQHKSQPENQAGPHRSSATGPVGRAGRQQQRHGGQGQRCHQPREQGPEVEAALPQRPGHAQQCQGRHPPGPAGPLARHQAGRAHQHEAGCQVIG